MCSGSAEWLRQYKYSFQTKNIGPYNNAVQTHYPSMHKKSVWVAVYAETRACKLRKQRGPQFYTKRRGQSMRTTVLSCTLGLHLASREVEPHLPHHSSSKINCYSSETLNFMLHNQCKSLRPCSFPLPIMDAWRHVIESRLIICDLDGFSNALHLDGWFYSHHTWKYGLQKQQTNRSWIWCCMTVSRCACWQKWLHQ